VSRRAGQAYLLYAASLLLTATFGSLFQLRSMRLGLAFTELVLILAPALLFVRWKRLPVSEALRWQRPSPAVALLSLAVGITSWGVAAGMVVLASPLVGDPPSIPALQPRTLPDLFWALLIGALLAGLCEESLFRGVLQGVLRRKGRLRGVVITAALFAVFHLNPWLLLPTFFLGLVYGVLVLRTGSTVPAILAHAATNVTAFSVVYLFRDRPEPAVYPLIGALALVCLLTYPLLWRATRRAETRESRPPVLATVPAGLDRPGLWLLGLIGGGVVVLLVAAATAALLLIGVHTVSDDSFAPEARPGDSLIIFRGGLVELDLEVGDIVTFERDGATALGRIESLDEESVRVGDGEAVQHLARREITGKVVHVLEPVSSAEPEG